MNRVKHREPLTFEEESLFEQHTLACYRFTARKVVIVDEVETEESSGSQLTTFKPTGRGRVRGSLQQGPDRKDSKKKSAKQA